MKKLSIIALVLCCTGCLNLDFLRNKDSRCIYKKTKFEIPFEVGYGNADQILEQRIKAKIPDYEIKIQQGWSVNNNEHECYSFGKEVSITCVGAISICPPGVQADDDYDRILPIAPKF